MKTMKIHINDRTLKVVIALIQSMFCCLMTVAAVETKSLPNILWIVIEDIGCDMGVYGTKGVHTPNMDQLAAEGALYTRAYTAASTCSPSRASFMTGLYAHQVFAQHQRIFDEKKKKALPKGVDIFTKYLRDAGYAIGLCNYLKRDWQFAPPETEAYDTNKWNELTENQPFFCQYQFHDTHRANLKGPNGERWPFVPCPEHPVDRAKVELNPYMPDTPEAREELGAYLENVNLVDMKIGKLLADLKAKGLYDNTIIVLMGDNGPAIFRGKEFLYERGILTPLIVRVPELFQPGFNPGFRSDELVSAMDMAPTFISYAGGHIPDYMSGRVFFGPNKQPEPEYLFATRDRVDLDVDRVRSVCSKKYKYIRNFMPEVTYYDSCVKNVAAANAGAKLYKEGKLSGAQAAYYKSKPKEELYDLKSDSFEMNNRAGDPAFNEILVKFRNELENWRIRTQDNAAPENIEEVKQDFKQLEEETKNRRLKENRTKK
jgi:uncharacterized sulfatase